MLGPTKSFCTSGRDEDDAVNNELDPLVNVPELAKNRIQQGQSSLYPHWFDISSGGVGLTAFNSGKITIWDVENGKSFFKFNTNYIDLFSFR